MNEYTTDSVRPLHVQQNLQPYLMQKRFVYYFALIAINCFIAPGSSTENTIISIEVNGLGGSFMTAEVNPADCVAAVNEIKQQIAAYKRIQCREVGLLSEGERYKPGEEESFMRKILELGKVCFVAKDAVAILNDEIPGPFEKKEFPYVKSKFGSRVELIGEKVYTSFAAEKSFTEHLTDCMYLSINLTKIFCWFYPSKLPPEKKVEIMLCILDLHNKTGTQVLGSVCDATGMRVGIDMSKGYRLVFECEGFIHKITFAFPGEAPNRSLFVLTSKSPYSDDFISVLCEKCIEIIEIL